MAPRFTWLAFVTTSVTTSGAMKCPGSPSWVHASAQVEAMADGTCQDVIEEIQARVAGWHDPHNGGQYSLLQEDALYLDIKRVTGNKRFTDKLTFTFSDFPGAKPACGIHACSESQVFSLKDFSTNYCNVRNLYCGKEDGCVPVKHNLSVSEVKLTPSRFAGTDKDACIVKNAEVEISMLRQSPALLGATVDDTLACISGCPLDDSTLQPSPLCVLESCTSNLAKCLFSSSCRDGVMCEMKCTEPLAKTEEAVHFAGLMECMRVHCPGFPPKKSCAALHCSVEAASCAVHSKCRHTLECADKCVPDKYTAALTATDLPMPQEAVVKTSMLRQSPALLGATVDDTLACISSCPLDDSTLQPSPLCVLESCTSSLAKCLFSSSCRDGVMCEMKCTEPLAKTEEAVHFAGLMECMRVHCPGFPPKKSCAALHCSVEAASCAVHSKCRHTLECADKCVPDKYTAALTATDLPMPQEAVV